MTHHLHINFLSEKLLYRCKHASLKKERLARAMGCHPREHPTIIDATAGLGRDSLILASLGFHIILIERSPILHGLLANAMEKASEHPLLSPVIKRMQLIHANAIDWIPKHPFPDIIYLDPMFPERKKSASVKKEMVMLQDILGKEADADEDQLFNVALTCATRRVVVKRPRLAEYLSAKKPGFSLMGKSSRFDIYLTQPKR